MIDLQPIAEKIVYDLQAATGQEVELIVASAALPVGEMDREWRALP